MCLGSNGAASESLLEEHADHHRRGKTPPDVAGVRGPSRRDPTPTTPSTANSQHKLTSISKHKSTSICKLLENIHLDQKSCPCLNHGRLSNFSSNLSASQEEPQPYPLCSEQRLLRPSVSGLRGWGWPWGQPQAAGGCRDSCPSPHRQSPCQQIWGS